MRISVKRFKQIAKQKGWKYHQKGYVMGLDGKPARLRFVFTDHPSIECVSEEILK